MGSSLWELFAPCLSPFSAPHPLFPLLPSSSFRSCPGFHFPTSPSPQVCRGGRCWAPVLGCVGPVLGCVGQELSPRPPGALFLIPPLPAQSLGGSSLSASSSSSQKMRRIWDFSCNSDFLTLPAGALLAATRPSVECLGFG